MIPQKFDGNTFDPEADQGRLSKQLERVRELMLDGQWRSLKQIHDMLGYPEASISSRLRDLRKQKFGSFVVEKKRVGPARMGIYFYQVLPPAPVKQTEFLFNQN